jgi:hypothetical protein
MERGASVDYVNPLTNKTALLYAIDESNFYDVENLVKRMLIVHRLICYGATTIFHNDSMDRKVIMFIGHMALTNFRSILFPDLRK